MLHHPDLNKGNADANEKLMEIKEAYTTLINDEKRTAYNNKIGFYHSDPPPDFKREWTFQAREKASVVVEDDGAKLASWKEGDNAMFEHEGKYIHHGI